MEEKEKSLNSPGRSKYINELGPIREGNKAKRTEEKRVVKGLEVFVAPKREYNGNKAKI